MSALDNVRLMSRQVYKDQSTQTIAKWKCMQGQEQVFWLIIQMF